MRLLNELVEDPTDIGPGADWTISAPALTMVLHLRTAMFELQEESRRAHSLAMRDRERVRPKLAAWGPNLRPNSPSRRTD